MDKVYLDGGALSPCAQNQTSLVPLWHMVLNETCAVPRVGLPGLIPNALSPYAWSFGPASDLETGLRGALSLMPLMLHVSCDYPDGGMWNGASACDDQSPAANLHSRGGSNNHSLVSVVLGD